ncbi:MAG TPA: DUF2304 domain-containing protein [Candidatus Dormibacteraeota bacterium]|nr:DUF2304 domain-containing protein [Candidatus Dormibacteraeota bacterium]
MPPLLQVLTLLFGVAMAYLTYVGFRRHQFGIGGLVFWEIVWLALVLVSIVPLPHQPLSRALGAARLLDLAIVVAILIMSTVTYRTYVAVQLMRRRLEELVRTQALAELPTTGAARLQSEGPATSA